MKNRKLSSIEENVQGPVLSRLLKYAAPYWWQFVICLLLVLVMVVAMTACGDENKKPYEEAVAAYNNGYYEEAAEKLADKEAVMLSHTFVHNLRYTKTLAEIKKHCDVTHFLSECDTRIIVNRSGVKFIPYSYTVKPVVWQGSISGAKLKETVMAVERYFLSLIEKGETCDRKCLSEFLKKHK